MTSLKTLALASVTAAVAAVGIVATTTSASAYIACNREGDCWHTDRRYHPPGVVLNFHPDDWYFHQHWDADHHWRELHEGRGYWRGGAWVTF